MRRAASRSADDRPWPPWTLVALASVPALALGGTRPWAIVLWVAVAAAAVLAGLWGRQRRRLDAELPPLTVLGCAATAFALAQLVPVPSSLAARLSPTAWETRMSAAEALGETLPSWMPLTLTPGDTGGMVAIACGWALSVWAGWLAGCRGSRTGSLVQALEIALASVLVVITFHAIAASDSIYGEVVPVGRGMSPILGPFVNANHLGSFLVVTSTLLLATASESSDGVRRAGRRVLGLLGMCAATLSLSRGAIVGQFIALAVLSVLPDRRKGGELGVGGVIPERAGYVVVLTAALAVGAILSGGVLIRVMEPRQFLNPSGKAAVWGYAWATLRDFPWVGVGHGGFADVASRYRDVYAPYTFRFVESSYLQPLIDFGVLIGGCLLVLSLVGLVLPLLRLARRSRPSGFDRGAIAAGIALLVQSAVDFHVYIPGVAAPAAVIAGAAAARAARRRGRPYPTGVLAGVAIALAGTGMAGGFLHQVKGHRAMNISVDRWSEPAFPSSQAVQELRNLALARPSDPTTWLALARRIEGDPAVNLRLVNHVIGLDPVSPRPHLAAATTLLGLGHRGQGLLEIRTALELGGRYETAVIDWLFTLEDDDDRCTAAPRRGEAQIPYLVRLFDEADAPCLAELIENAAVNTDDAVVDSMLVQTRSRAGDLAGAREAAFEASKRTNDGGEGLILLAGVQMQASEDKAAEATLVRAVAKTDAARRCRAVAALAELYLRESRASEAVALVRIQRVRTPFTRSEVAQMYDIEARALDRDGRPFEALEAAREAVTHHPDSPSYRTLVRNLEARAIGSLRQ